MTIKTDFQYNDQSDTKELGSPDTGKEWQLFKVLSGKHWTIMSRRSRTEKQQLHKQRALLKLPVNYFGFFRHYKNLCMIMKTSLQKKKITVLF